MRRKEKKGGEKLGSRCRLAFRDQAKFLFCSPLARSQKHSLSLSPLSTPTFAITRIESITWWKNRGELVQESASESASFFLQFASISTARSAGGR